MGPSAVDGALAVPVAQLNDLEARRRHRRAPCLFRELSWSDAQRRRDASHQPDHNPKLIASPYPLSTPLVKHAPTIQQRMGAVLDIRLATL
eukprot:scaffold60869_cov54-Phaeocystis_antarctica.AAC.1